MSQRVERSSFSEVLDSWFTSSAESFKKALSNTRYAPLVERAFPRYLLRVYFMTLGFFTGIILPILAIRGDVTGNNPRETAYNLLTTIYFPVFVPLWLVMMTPFIIRQQRNRKAFITKMTEALKSSFGPQEIKHVGNRERIFRVVSCAWIGWITFQLIGTNGLTQDVLTKIGMYSLIVLAVVRMVVFRAFTSRDKFVARTGISSFTTVSVERRELNVYPASWGSDFRWSYLSPETMRENTTSFRSFLSWAVTEYKGSQKCIPASCCWKLPSATFIDDTEEVETTFNRLVGVEFTFNFDWPGGCFTFKPKDKLPQTVMYPLDYDVTANPLACPIAVTLNGPAFYDPLVVPHIGILATTGFGKSELAKAICFHGARVNIALEREFWKITIIDLVKDGKDFFSLKGLPGIRFITNAYEVPDYLASLELESDSRNAKEIAYREQGMTVKESEQQTLQDFGVHFTFFDEFTHWTTKTPDAKQNKVTAALAGRISKLMAVGRSRFIFWGIASQEISESSFSQWMRTNIGYRAVGYISTIGGSGAAMGTSDAFSLNADHPGRGFFGTVGKMALGQAYWLLDKDIDNVRLQYEASRNPVLKPDDIAKLGIPAQNTTAPSSAKKFGTLNLRRDETA